jgi:hypothetical protein
MRPLSSVIPRTGDIFSEFKRFAGSFPQNESAAITAEPVVEKGLQEWASNVNDHVFQVHEVQDEVVCLHLVVKHCADNPALRVVLWSKDEICISMLSFRPTIISPMTTSRAIDSEPRHIAVVAG